MAVEPVAEHTADADGVVAAAGRVPSTVGSHIAAAAAAVHSSTDHSDSCWHGHTAAAAADPGRKEYYWAVAAVAAAEVAAPKIRSRSRIRSS